MLNENSVHLRIEFDDGTSKFFTCGGAKHAKGRIDDVFSYRHATKEGWRFSAAQTPGKYAAICPECVKNGGYVH